MRKTLTSGDRTISYRDSGAGETVVLLLHGFGETGDVWDEQVNFLVDRFRFIVPDLPGSGASEMIADMSMEGLAVVARGILDQEKIEHCHLIGHSMGGYVALAFAERYADSLLSLGLFSSTAYPDSEEKKATRKKGIEFIQAHGAFAFLKSTSPNLFSGISKDENPKLVDQFVDSLSNFSPAPLVLYYESMMKRPERTDILVKSTVPVLFIMGEFDNAIPLKDVLPLCSLPKKSYIHILSRSGHMGMLEEKSRSNKILEKFLTEA